MRARTRADRRRTANGLPDARRLISTAAWGWRLIWQESAVLFVSIAVVTVVRGVVPAALALVIRELVNAVVALIEAGGGDWSSTLPWLFAGFALASLEAIGRLANNYMALRLGDDLHIRVTADIMRHAGELDLTFFEDPSQRDLIERTQQNTGPRVARLVTESQIAVTSLLQVMTLLAVLVAIEPWVLWAVPPFAIPFFLFQWQLAKQRYMEEHTRATKRRWSGYHMSLMTGPYSVAEIRLLDLGPLLGKRFRELMAEFRDRDRVLHRRNLIGSSIAALLTLGAFWALFARVTLRTIAGAATIGDLAIYAGATGRLRTAIEQTIRSASVVFEQTLFVQNLQEFMAVRPTLRTSSKTQSEQTGGGADPSALADPGGRGAAIRLENVSFTYPGSEREVLSDISLGIEPGETVAIVGENGAGKSTLAKLIARLYDPDSGRILWNGVDVRDLDPDQLHAQIRFVFQNFGQYEGTVGDNIAFGDWRGLLGDGPRVEELAKRARVDGFVNGLPDGYDTVVGRRFGAVTLSGGQWQQLAMARAFAQQGSLLILDEPTSTLDARSEYELFARFKELAAGRTTILISHRFSTIGMADRVIVLAEGRIAEIGTHDELLAAAGTYAALWALHKRLLP